MRITIFRRVVLISALLACFIASLGEGAQAEVLDKVVAFIDTEAITLSEVALMHSRMAEFQADISEVQVLETIINRSLLLREARRLRLGGEDDDALLDEYVDIKIRAFARVDEQSIRHYYSTQKEDLGGLMYDEARDRIETYLRELEVNRMLREHINELRSEAYIKILLE